MSQFLLTGGAGFIGSNLARYLLKQGGTVRILDDFSTGKRENLAELEGQIEVTEGDLRNRECVISAAEGCDGIFHLGALGSVPRSIDDPDTTTMVNVLGTVNVLEAARKVGIKRVVFSASSAAYGDQPISPKVESMPVQPISPYAASKVCGEAYMRAYAAVYGLETVSLRYFNVFGPRQDPNGAYAAVIPAFISALLKKEAPTVYGNGEQTRDFCHIDNVCHANWLAMNAPAKVCDGSPINIACNEEISLNRILLLIQTMLDIFVKPHYTKPRPGDIKHSLANIDRAKNLLGYEPLVRFDDGLEKSLDWYKQSLSNM